MTPDPSKQNEDVLVTTLRKWLVREPHLPDTDIDDLLIRKFLHSCYWDIEKTKICLDKFCCMRVSMDDVYTHRDPLSPRIKTAFSITNGGAYKTPNDQEILIHKLNDPGLEKFQFYDAIKVFTLIGECWMLFRESFPKEHIIILDIKDYTLKVLPKVNILFLRTYFLFLLEATPVRLKQIHVINCPSFVDKLYALVKPCLPSSICDLINFHTDVAGLYKFIDKKSLPIEYGGEAQSLVEQTNDWIKESVERRNFFLNDNLFKANLKKKGKESKEIIYSFKKLDID